MTMALHKAVSVTALFLLPSCALVRAQAAPTTSAAAQTHLQGAWAGVSVGQESAGTYTLTITGSSLRYQGPKPEEWYEAKFTLPDGKYPQELHATITGCPRKDEVGSKVVAIFRIEDGTLSLAGADPDSDYAADPFEDNPRFRYKLKQVPPKPAR
jgi:hypothetical protein